MATGTASDRIWRSLSGSDAQRAGYALASVRPQAVMVRAAVPGERWEIEFMTDGSVEVERFRSDGTIAGEAALAELRRLFAAAAD